LRRGVPRVAAALRTGGWLMVAHGRFGGTPVQDALTRLKTIAYGGTPLDEAASCHLLRSAGLTSVRPVPTPAGAPGHPHGPKPALRAAVPPRRPVPGHPGKRPDVTMSPSG